MPRASATLRSTRSIAASSNGSVVSFERRDERLDVSVEICGRQMLADGVRIVLDRGRQERRGLTDEFRQSPHSWQH